MNQIPTIESSDFHYESIRNGIHDKGLIMCYFYVDEDMKVKNITWNPNTAHVRAIVNFDSDEMIQDIVTDMVIENGEEIFANHDIPSALACSYVNRDIFISPDFIIMDRTLFQHFLKEGGF